MRACVSVIIVLGGGGAQEYTTCPIHTGRLLLLSSYPRSLFKSRVGKTDHYGRRTPFVQQGTAIFSVRRVKMMTAMTYDDVVVVVVAAAVPTSFPHTRT